MVIHGLRKVVPVLMCAVGIGLPIVASGAEHELHLGAAVAHMAGAETVSQKSPEGVDEQFWRVGENFEIYLSPAMPEGTVKREDGRLVIGLGMKGDPLVDNLARIVYETRTGKMPYNVNITLAIFTHPGSDPGLVTDDGKWFQRQLQSEPLYITHLETRFTPNLWSTYSTDDPESPLGFYDPHHGPAGFGQPPTLEKIQQAQSYSQVWEECWKECGHNVPEDSYRYGLMKVRYVALTTASGGNWAKFKGDLHRLTLSVRGDDTLSVIFDAGNSPVIAEETTLAATPMNTAPTSTAAPPNPAVRAPAAPVHGPAAHSLAVEPTFIDRLLNGIAAILPSAQTSVTASQGPGKEDLIILILAGVGAAFVLLAGLLQWSRSRQPVKNGKRAPAR